MSAHSQISIVSLAKIGIREKLNQIRTANRMGKQDSPPVNADPAELIEDLPPSYYSTVSHDVDETSTKESISDYNIITSQPRANSTDSFELSTRSSLQSTKLSMDTRLLSSKTQVKRPVNNAWNEKIVIRNIYQRDQVSVLCFCASALGGIAALAFYCTSM